MKSLKSILVASVLVAGVAYADCCVTTCCVVTECVQKVVKKVPYQDCKTLCVPVLDSCGNVVCYKTVQQCTTKYKEVVVEKKVPCCCCY